MDAHRRKSDLVTILALMYHHRREWINHVAVNLHGTSIGDRREFIRKGSKKFSGMPFKATFEISDRPEPWICNVVEYSMDKVIKIHVLDPNFVSAIKNRKESIISIEPNFDPDNLDDAIKLIKEKGDNISYVLDLKPAIYDTLYQLSLGEKKEFKIARITRENEIVLKAVDPEKKNLIIFLKIQPKNLQNHCLHLCTLT
jgi:hypothetical protein